MCIQFEYLTFTLLTTSISCKRTILLATWINTFPPRGSVVIITITWNVFKVTTALTLWSEFSATCWIWTSGLTFRISVPLTTNAFRSNHWVSLYKLCNFGSFSESMENGSWNGGSSVPISLTAMFLHTGYFALRAWLASTCDIFNRFTKDTK